jgi:hypothetical protein
MEVNDEAHPSTQLHGRNQRKISPNSRMKIRQKYFKIKKKKNDSYNLEMRFTHKDQLYWENQTSIRCGKSHNILPLFGGLERSLTFSPLPSYTMKLTHTSQKATIARGGRGMAEYLPLYQPLGTYL